MLKIIPAINTQSFEEIQGKIKKIKEVSNIVHIDVADGSYTPNILWHDSEDLKKIDEAIKIEAHLMLAQIDKKIENWLIPQIKKIIFQVDASSDPKKLIEKIKSHGIEAGVATKPGISWTEVAHYKGIADYFLFLLVSPGKHGQKMDLKSLEDIRQMRRFCDSCTIEADGGLNEETIPLVLEAGADVFVSASAIFEKDNPIEALSNLRNISA